MQTNHQIAISLKNVVTPIALIFIMMLVNGNSCQQLFCDLHYLDNAAQEAPAKAHCILAPVPAEACKGVLIAGIARNCEKRVARSLAYIDNLRTLFQRTEVFIYENDSTDATPQILQNWAENRRDVKVKCERCPEGGYPDLVAIGGPPTRFDRIARARNVYMREIDQLSNSEFSHVIILDLDLVEYPKLESVCRCFDDLDWDCLTANGRHAETGIYYDEFAFRHTELPLGPEFCGTRWWYRIGLIQDLIDRTQNPRVEVLSAFGGMAIYAIDAIRGERYESYATKEMLDDAQLASRQSESVRKLLFACGCFGPVYARTPVAPKWERSNPGNLCEHVSLHFQMRKKGFQRIFVEKSLQTRWINN